MKTDYQIEELLMQDNRRVIYHARANNGVPHTLTRLSLPDHALENLTTECFDEGFMRLLNLRHSCLRSLVDGGLDPIDRIPWFASRWWEGVSLAEAIENQTLEAADVALIKEHGEGLIRDLGKYSGAISFQPEMIVTTRAADGQPIATFTISYYQWFLDWAKDKTPGGGVDAEEQLAKLVAHLGTLVESPPKLAVSDELTNGTLGYSQQVKLQPLASAEVESGKAWKVILALSVLVGLGIGTYFLAGKDADPSEAAPSNMSAVNEGEALNQKEEEAEEVPKDEAEIVPEAPKRRKARPVFAGELQEIDARDPKEILEGVGEWVTVTGKVVKISPSGLVSFEGSSLKTKLPKLDEDLYLGQLVNVTGFLASEQFLDVESDEDVEITLQSDRVFTIEDEPLLRKMLGEKVTVRAKALEFVRNPKGTSIYLAFTDKRPGFRASVHLKRAEKGLTEDWLQQFVGEEILVTGTVGEEKARSWQKYGTRLVVRLRTKDAIRLVGESDE